MYPSATSFIPLQVALARFFEQTGLVAAGINYPYWYLGSTPFRWLTGPVVPGLLAAGRHVFPQAGWYDLFWVLAVVTWLAGGAGMWFLARKLSGGDGGLAVLFWLAGPLVLLIFPFSDGVRLIGFAWLPWVLVSCLRFWEKGELVDGVTVGALSAGLLLTEALLLPQLVMAVVALAVGKYGWNGAGRRIKKSGLLLVLGVLTASIWYGAGFWWQLLGSPSFGGLPLYRVAGQLAKLLPVALAMGLALIAGKGIRARSSLARFAFYWTFVFAFLTVMRFLADPDYWLDWSGYGVELQLGVSLLLAVWVEKKTAKAQIMYACIYMLIFAYISWSYLIPSFQRDLSDTVEFRISRELSKLVRPGESVFLSGTTAFWLNANCDLVQFRGGRDQAARLKGWDELAWEIRESTDTEMAVAKLAEEGIDWLVVHGEESSEYWHDFRKPDRFEGVSGLVKAYDREGDRIYMVKQSGS